LLGKFRKLHGITKAQEDCRYNAVSMLEVRLQTYWADADPAGIVYFAHFFRLVEQAEEELFLQAGTNRQQLLDEHQVWLPRVEAHVNYFHPIRTGTAIRVRFVAQAIREKTVRLNFILLGGDTEERLAEGYVTIVCVDRAKFKSRPVPVEICAVFGL
jgi:acyl-CoA thioester hydrolase